MADPGGSPWEHGVPASGFLSVLRSDRPCLALGAAMVAAWTLTTGQGHAAAPPVLDLTAEGDCPDRAALASSMRAHGCTLGPSEWHASVRRVAGAARLELRNSAGQTVLDRQIESNDCAALAEAAALIVEAYFVEIGVMTAPSGSEPGVTPTTAEQTAPAPTATPNSEGRSDPARTTAGRRGEVTSARKHAGRTQLAPPFSSSRSLGWHGMAGLGPRAEAPALHFSGAAELGVGLDLPSPAVSARLAVATAVPRVLFSEPNRVSRWPSRALVQVGGRLGEDPVVFPWAGSGVSAVRVRAHDLPGATRRWVWSALVGLGVDTWWPLRRGWFAMTGLGCLVYISREAYRVDPDGEIGRGPRVDCGASLGAAWGEGIARQRFH